MWKFPSDRSVNYSVDITVYVRIIHLSMTSRTFVRSNVSTGTSGSVATSWSGHDGLEYWFWFKKGLKSGAVPRIFFFHSSYSFRFRWARDFRPSPLTAPLTAAENPVTRLMISVVGSTVKGAGISSSFF